MTPARKLTHRLRPQEQMVVTQACGHKLVVVNNGGSVVRVEHCDCVPVTVPERR